MLLRDEGEGRTLCVGQAAHAWISGQLARAWAGLSRREEVCLAAEQHDVAWLAWDARPERDPRTGLPHSFTSIPARTWIELWSPAPGELATQSAYAALLVSMHGTRLRHGDAGFEGYLRAQAELQERLLAQTRAERDEALRHRDLLALWDGLSLALCLRWEPFARHGVRLARVEGETFTLEPWPLAVGALEVGCEGRLVEGRFEDDETLRDALDRAPLRPLRFRLRPA
jgi:hypothetical protein